jgi:hypothetical protein
MGTTIRTAAMRTDQARAHDESLLERLTSSDKVLPDDDGDYRVRSRNCPYYGTERS